MLLNAASNALSDGLLEFSKDCNEKKVGPK